MKTHLFLVFIIITTGRPSVLYASIVGDLFSDPASFLAKVTDGTSLVETSLNILFRMFDTHYYDSTTTTDPNATYDFIIVGAGSAGSVLANRLSELTDWNVLILEAGGEPPIIVDIPLALSALQYTPLDWSYWTEPDNLSCGACVNRRMHYPRGKTLGGSSTINYMMNVRGNKHDYDSWAKQGNEGWSYDDVLPYFKKLEDATNVEIQDPGFHGKDGYLTISDVPTRSGIAEAFISAAQEAGYPYVDYNGKSQLGTSWIQASIRDGKRCSAEKAFLRPARDRSNLNIVFNAQVIKVLINNKSKEAYGIQYVKDNIEYTVKASKEVILSAGAFHSPQLLMLSGVGPKEDLKKLGINVIHDLPVGQTMYDHLCFLALAYQINETQIVTRSLFLQPSTTLDFLIRDKGPLTSLGGSEALCFINTNTSSDIPVEYPDIEIILFGTTFAIDYGLVCKETFSISQEAYDGFWKKLEDTLAFHIMIMLAHPKSVGYLKLQSTNIKDQPLFYPKYLSDDRDVKTYVAAIREAQRIAKHPALQRYNATLVDIPAPGCEDEVFDSDEYWACTVHNYAITIHHQTGTSKMGPKNDPKAVVDDKLKVYGIDNLRVVDAGIMPGTIVGHTNIPTMMIAEKAADMIKEKWNGSG